MPQAATLAVVTHLPVVSQQPVGHVVASHTGFAAQAPRLQNCVSEQTAQAPPALPHTVWLLPVEHLPLASQQPVQLDGPQTTALHALVKHCSVAAQVAQAPPPIPQAAAFVPGAQAPLRQQPLGQLAGLQPVAADLHAPSIQVSPEAQAPQASPSTPQRFGLVAPE